MQTDRLVSGGAWPALEVEPPVASGALTVFPIRQTSDRVPDYLLLSEALRQGVAEVTEVSEHGSVPVLLLRNTSSQPILLVQGEQLVGAKQHRTLNVSILAGSGKLVIPVTCVEAGRWHRMSRSFSLGQFEHHELRMMKSGQVAEARKRYDRQSPERFSANQGEVWKEVARVARMSNVASPTSSLNDVFDDRAVASDVSELIHGVAMPAGSCGAVVGIGQRIVAAELFESASVFERLWPRILRSYAFSALEVARHDRRRAEAAATDAELSKAAPNLEAARAFVSRPTTVAGEPQESVGLGEDVRWETDDVLASALFHEDRLLHGTVYWRPPAQREHRPTWHSESYESVDDGDEVPF